MNTLHLSLLLTSCTFIMYLLRPRNKSQPTRVLPPGPKPLPLIGNITDFTTKELWLKAAQWAKEYGPITHLNIFSQSIVILNTPASTAALLNEKGSLYSDKPKLVMVGELCGCENMVAFTPYGDQSRRQRKLLNSAFGVGAIPSYHGLITKSTTAFLRNLISKPADFEMWIKNYAGTLTLSVVYGYQITNPTTDPFLNLADECVDLLANKIAGGGGLWLVDIFPGLQRLPEWLPGMSFMRKSRVWKAKMEEFVEKPFNWLVDSVKSGDYLPSFCSNLLESSDPKKQTDEFIFDLKWTANSMYSASIDSTLTVVLHFILAMIQYPEKMAKAQEEIDRVVGKGRLPGFEDRADLPYVEALLSEIYRWGVPVPLNLPHRLTEDDVYDGMSIPKGSLVFGNVWSICRDPNMYPNPEEFIPERFLNVSPSERKLDPRNYVFGFGRRRCPGQNLVESSIWLMVVSMLATLNIGKAKDESGNEKELKVDFNNAVFRTPDSFECDIRPRSAEAVKVIRESELAI